MLCPICGANNKEEAAFSASCSAMLSGERLPSNLLATGADLMGGTYRVDYPIGQGAFAVTYRGRDVRLAREVAVKEFFPSGCLRRDDAVRPGYGWPEEEFRGAKERFLREGQAMARFRNPGIVHVLHAFEGNNTAYLVMEFIHGQTLQELVKARGPLPEKEAVGYIREAASALEVVHGAGLLHRDIKPANIMLTDKGRVVLIDFGAAKEYALGVTQPHSVVLTPGYAPLEQYAVEARRGPFTDIYALAGTLYYLLTGQPPAAATDRLQGLEPAAIRQFNPDVSERIIKAVEHGMAMDAAARPQSAAEFLNELAGPADTKGLTVPVMAPHATLLPDPVPVRAEPVVPRASRQTSTRRASRGMPVGAAALLPVVIVAGIATGVIASRQRKDIKPTVAATYTASSAHAEQAGMLDTTGRTAGAPSRTAATPGRTHRRRKHAASSHLQNRDEPNAGAADTTMTDAQAAAVPPPVPEDAATSQLSLGQADRNLASHDQAADSRTDNSASDGDESTVGEGSTNYGSDNSGFNIRRPVGWSASVERDPDATRTWFRPPHGSASLMVEMAPGASPDYPTQTWTWQDREFRRTYGDGYHLLGVTHSTLGGRPAEVWTFTLQQGDRLYKKTDILTTRHGAGYAILAAAPVDEFDSLQGDFDGTVSSFRFVR